jgi:hypothetical protein
VDSVDSTHRLNSGSGVTRADEQGKCLQRDYERCRVTTTRLKQGTLHVRRVTKTATPQSVEQ